MITELAATTAKFEWSCIGFCLLTTHYHFIIETFDESLSAGLQRLNFRHAVRHNVRFKLRGHLFDGRFSSRRITSEEQLLVVYRYVVRNALDAGLCATASEWPWGSYRSLTEPVESCSFVDISRVAACFRPEETAIEQLRRFVDSSW